MRSVFAWLPLAALAGATAAAVAQDGPKDLDRLQGEWKRVRVEVDGQAADVDSDPNPRLRVRGDRIILVRDGQPLKGRDVRIQLDPTTDPKLIDLTLPDGRVMEGVYKFEGKRWTVCFRTQAAVRDRPVRFETQPGSNLVLLVLEKEE